MNKLFAKIAVSLLSVGMAVGVGVAVGHNDARSARAADESYVLTPTSGANNSYAGNCDVTIDGIKWNLTGNSQANPWRIGGKSLNKVDRTVYSKTAMPSPVSKVDLVVGTASNITVNSLKLDIASNSDYSTIIDTISGNFAANSTISFTPTSGKSWGTGSYYKFTFNVTVSGSSNKFVEFKSAKFHLVAEEKAIAVTALNIKHGETTIADNSTYVPTDPIVPGSLQLTAEVSYLVDTTHKKGDGVVSWESVDTDVATISENGLVTYVSAGETIITVTTEDKDSNGEFVSVSFILDISSAGQEEKIVSYSFTDRIDRAFTGISGTTYANWTGKSGSASSAVYAGQSAGGNESIQLRSSNNNSGIVSTTSGGNVRKIVVTWNSSTAAARILEIYGSNTAYTAATDLYNSESQGSLIGSITKSNQTEATIEGNYKYVGLRSNDGAMYISKIEITWETIPDAATVELADNFIKNFMHMDHIKDDGSCTGWYEETKAEFAKLSEEAKGIIIFSNSFYDEEVGDTVEGVRYTYADVRARLSEWARINGETFTTDGEFTKGSNRIGNMFNSMTSSTGVVITVISLLTVSTLGAYFLLKKRKEQ